MRVDHDGLGETMTTNRTKEDKELRTIDALPSIPTCFLAQPRVMLASSNHDFDRSPLNTRLLHDQRKGLFRRPARSSHLHAQHFCLDAKTTASLTGISNRSVYHVLSTWKRTGKVKPAPEGKQGRPRVLDFADTQVSSFHCCCVVNIDIESPEVPSACRDLSQQ